MFSKVRIFEFSAKMDKNLLMTHVLKVNSLLDFSMSKTIKPKPFIEKCFYSDANQPFMLWNLYDEFYDLTNVNNEPDYDAAIVDASMKECQEQIKRIASYMSLNTPLTFGKLSQDLTRYFVGIQRVCILLCRQLRRYLGEEIFLSRLNAYAAQLILKKNSSVISKLFRKAFMDRVQSETLIGPPKASLDVSTVKVIECITKINQPEIFRAMVIQPILDNIHLKSILPLPEVIRGQRNWLSYLLSVKDISKQLYFFLLSTFATHNHFVLSDYSVFPEPSRDPGTSSNRSLHLTTVLRIKLIMDTFRAMTYQKYSASIFYDFVDNFIKTVKPFDKFVEFDIDTQVLNLFFMFNSPDTESYGNCLESSLEDPSNSNNLSTTTLESYSRLSTCQSMVKVKPSKDTLGHKFMTDFIAITFRAFTKKFSNHEKVLQSAPRSLDQWHYSVFHLLTYFERFMTLITQRVFYNSHKFIEMWRSKMIELINTKPGHTQCDSIYKCLVFFAHRSLNTSKSCDPTTLEVIGQSMRLYRYFKEKEFFENWYRTKLANRLLSPIHVNLPDELKIVRSMINQIDISYVNGLETMINDIDLSIQKTAIFNRNDEPELRVCALNEFFWKSSLPVQPEIVNILPCYKQFTTRIKETYAIVHPHRTLNFIFNASWVIVEYWLTNQESCKLLLTFQQHLIMEEILKIDPNPIKSSQIEMTFKNIFTMIEIKRALHLLTKFEIINKKDLEKDSEYSINRLFINKSRASLVNMKGASNMSLNKHSQPVINLTSLRQGSSLEAFGKVVPKAKVIDTVDSNNRWTVEAAIIRVLKAEKSKSLDYKDLRQMVIDQLRNRYNRHVDHQSIQICVQKLKKERFIVSQNIIFDGSKPNPITYLP